MLWENGNIKINLSGKSKSEKICLSQDKNLQMMHEAHTAWNGNCLRTLCEANECWLPLQEFKVVKTKKDRTFHI